MDKINQNRSILIYLILSIVSEEVQLNSFRVFECFKNVLQNGNKFIILI